MKLTRPVALAALLAAGAAAIGAWGYVILPAAARIAINYHGPGQAPDGTVPKAVGLAIMPAVSAIVTVCLAIAPYRARLIKGFEASSGAYGLLVTSLAALFLVTEGALVGQAMDPDFDALRWVFLAAAVLLMLVGNTLGKVRHNDVFGVRTPATLADARVWDKTHRFTGRLMVLGAAALAAIAVVWPNHTLLVAALVLAAVGPMIAGAVYAYLIAPRPAAG